MKKVIFPFLLIFSFCFALQSQNAAQPEVESTSYQLMLKALLDHSVPEVSVEEVVAEKNVVLLDAREISEFEMSHIKDAVWVGYDDFDLKRVKDIDKDSKVVVYCSVGYRSEKISEKLKADGFTDVANLYGGIFEWGNKDHPVENASGEAEIIHPYDGVWGLWLKKEKRAKDY